MSENRNTGGRAGVERLFDPLTIGGITARNWLAVAPMTRVSATEAGHATARRDFVAETRPDDAGRFADYVVTTMVGLSTMARQGCGLERLRRVASLAAVAVKPGA